MKKETTTEPTTAETNAQPWRMVVSKLLASKEDARPVITCECALWGSPCPHSFWSEQRATTANAN